MNWLCLPYVCSLQHPCCTAGSGNPSQDEWLASGHSVNIAAVERSFSLVTVLSGSWAMGCCQPPASSEDNTASLTKGEHVAGEHTALIGLSTTRHCSEHPLGVQVYLQLLLVRLVLLLTNGNCFAQAVCAHIQRCSKDNTPSLAEKIFPFHISVGSIVIIGLILTFQYSIHHTHCICGSFLWQISCTT